MQGLLAALTLLLTLFLEAFMVKALPPAPRPAPLTLYQIFELTQDDEYDYLIVRAAEDWALDPFLLKGLLFIESKFKPQSTNSDSGAAGIAQFTNGKRGGINGLNRIRCLRLYQRSKCDLGEDVFTRAKAFDPVEAVPAAAELLAFLMRRYGRDYGLASYNGNYDKYNFARKVIRQTNYYRLRSGLPPLPARDSRRLRPPKPVLTTS